MFGVRLAIVTFDIKISIARFENHSHNKFSFFSLRLLYLQLATYSPFPCRRSKFSKNQFLLKFAEFSSLFDIYAFTLKQ
jgi:hypothetical protein